jgi:hypothetical protein
MCSSEKVLSCQNYRLYPSTQLTIRAQVDHGEDHEKRMPVELERRIRGPRKPAAVVRQPKHQKKHYRHSDDLQARVQQLEAFESARASSYRVHPAAKRRNSKSQT